MRAEEELEKLRQEKSVLQEALRSKDEGLQTVRQTIEELREGFKQALMVVLQRKS